MEKTIKYEENRLRKLQLIELQLLCEFDKICKENNLTYWIGYGTVLGAVRHKGFIPWDDDIDVCMSLKDYKKFLEIAGELLPSHILLLFPHKGSNYNKNFAKLMDLTTTLIEKNDALFDGEFRGIYLDIFPMVSYPDIPERWNQYFTKKMVLLLEYKKAYKPITLRNILRWFKNNTIYFSYRLLWLIFSLRKSDYIEMLPYDNGYGVRYREGVVYPLTTLEFEGKHFPAPRDYDTYLKIIYGDYMILPPPEKRIAHFLFFDPENSYPHPLGIKK